MSALNRIKLKQLMKIFNNVQRKTYKLKHTMPLFDTAKKHLDKIAIRDNFGNYTYGNIFMSAKELSQTISTNLEGKKNERILFLCSNDVNYVITLWAIWLSGQIAVPLSPLHPENILLYYANDTKSNLLITSPEHQELMDIVSQRTKTKLQVLDQNLRNNDIVCKENDFAYDLPQDFYNNSNAMILYTSGTTGNPKGVVLSHKNLKCQVNTLIDAWKWTSDDIILHTLPLHHVHGTVNALFCPLYAGAKTVMLPKFSPKTVWSYLLGEQNDKVNVFMAVPTIYSILIDEHKTQNLTNTNQILQNNLRLMVSGSAPLPVPVYDKWLQISGHKLLERYGMTEIGMCLSNGYDSASREPGFVGLPLPGVSIQLANNEEKSNYKTLLECTNNGIDVKFNKKVYEDVTGELLVKGDGIFKEYFNNPQATQKEFTKDGWFKTGDMCQYVVDKNKFRMLGRTSVDIIKSGGYKISALQIETTLLANPAIKECAIVGVNDDQWGEMVSAIIVPEKGEQITLENLREWASNKMPKYSLPTKLKLVDSIPKNAMGKVNKKELVKTMFP